MTKNHHDRLTHILEVLEAVETLEYHDKNFLASENSVSSLKRELLKEANNLLQLQIVLPAEPGD